MRSSRGLSALIVIIASLAMTAGASADSPPTNTTLPAITGTTAQGSVLSTSTGTWTGSPSTYTYQWQDCDASGSNCTDINLAVSSSHALTASDVGHTLRVVVTAYGSGGSGSATSDATSVVTNAPPTSSGPVNTSPPTISGSATEGSTLTADPGQWAGAPTLYIYQWQDCDASGSNCTNFLGAVNATHVVTQGEVGSTIRVIVMAYDNLGEGQATSAPTAVVTVGANSSLNTALPTITGYFTPGAKVVGHPGKWRGKPSSYIYRWADCVSGKCTLTVDTHNYYKIAKSDLGHTLQLQVTVVVGQSVGQASSAPTPVIIPKPVLSRVHLGAGSWHEGPHLGHVGSQSVGTILYFSLNEKATVKLRITYKTSKKHTATLTSQTIKGLKGANQTVLLASRHVRPQRYTISLLATNTAGPSRITTLSMKILSPLPRPRLTAVRETHRSFRVGSGTTFSFKLNESASVALRVGGSTIRTVSGHTGLNHVSFSGSTANGPLPSGHYAVTFQATNFIGASNKARLAFTIL